jgi:hypothetical protein
MRKRTRELSESLEQQTATSEKNPASGPDRVGGNSEGNLTFLFDLNNVQETPHSVFDRDDSYAPPFGT